MKDSKGRPAVFAASILMAAVVLVAPLSYAHHSSAMFDDKKTITVEGAVTKFEWSNPHVYIYIKQLTNSGDAVEWELEASPPSILRRLGWSQDTLQRGDTITVTGRPSRDASRKSILPNLIKRGDTTLFDRKAEITQLASAGSAPPNAASNADLAGVWVTLLAPKLEEQLEPDKLSLTREGKAAVKHFDEKKMHPGADCVPYPAPVFMITPDLKRITNSGNVMLVDGEFDGAQRTIHMDVSTHDGIAPSIQGHSIARWEGKSLVIDTALFAHHGMGNSYGLPSGTQKHLVERLTPDGKGALAYHFVLTDPEYLAAPVEGEVQWVFRPNLTYAPPKCDLDNAKRFAQ